MAYGRKRRRTYCRSYRRPRRYARRSRFGRRFTGVPRTRLPSTNRSAAVGRILALGKRARADDSLIQLAVKKAKALFAGGLGDPAALREHAGRFSNPLGLSTGEMASLLGNRHVVSAARNYYGGNYYRAVYDLYNAAMDHPYMSTDLVAAA